MGEFGGFLVSTTSTRLSFGVTVLNFGYEGVLGWHLHGIRFDLAGIWGAFGCARKHGATGSSQLHHCAPSREGRVAALALASPLSQRWALEVRYMDLLYETKL